MLPARRYFEARSKATPKRFLEAVDELRVAITDQHSN
jgi:hypothetical protein